MFKPTCVLLLSLVTAALAEMEGFIVGGNYASINNHAHSAFLTISCLSPDRQKSGFICGSSVVNQNILLTAAHCLYGCITRSHIRINLGSENRHKGQTYSTDGFVVHENYSPMTSQNDICLIRSEHKLVLGKKVGRVAIMKNPPYSEKASVAGWGLVDEIRELQSDQLKFVSQKIWTRNRCIDVLGFIPRGTICAANPNTSDYPSSGDSGSALVIRGFIQIGLVSYKVPELGRHIVIYTDVAYYYDWIQTNAKQLSCMRIIS